MCCGVRAWVMRVVVCVVDGENGARVVRGCALAELSRLRAVGGVVRAGDGDGQLVMHCTN